MADSRRNTTSLMIVRSQSDLSSLVAARLHPPPQRTSPRTPCTTALLSIGSTLTTRSANPVPVDARNFADCSIMDVVLCPLCHQRKARRMCPALGKQICTVCCGTKRQVEIHCPSDCTYLLSAREHPPVAMVRKHRRDLGVVVRFMQDLSERQSRLFFLIMTFLVRYQPPELHPLIDDDVAEA